MPAGLLDIPDVRQRDDHSCGPAVLSALYAFHGIHRPVSFFRAQLGCNGLDGVDPRTVEARLRQDDFRVVSGEFAEADLRWHPRQGRPVIVLIQHGQTGHYCLVRGVSRGSVHYLDPIDGLTAMKTAAFLAVWHDFDGRFGCPYERWGMAVWR